MRKIGLHLRLTHSLMGLAHKAERLGIPIFQCFFVLQSTGKLVCFSDEQIEAFKKIRQKKFEQLFLHGSYWINLASLKYNGLRAFKREFARAEKLGFNYIILHPGHAKGGKTKLDGIDALAKALNSITKNESPVQVVLENTVHGRLTVGSDLNDFALLREKLDFPERISFCIDTSHAYAYGYDISKPTEQEKFILLLEKTMGIENIVLIHLNDTKHKLGSRIDQHAIPGQGNIGLRALKDFVLHKKLKEKPIILELPILTDEQEEKIVDMVRSWHE